MERTSWHMLISSELTMTEQKERALFWWCMIVFLLGFWVLVAVLIK